MTALLAGPPDTARTSVLDARTAALARPPAAGRARDCLDVLLVTVGTQALAVPVDALREVRPPAPLAPVPGGGAVLTGVTAGHAGALVVASLAPLLGLAAARPPAEQWVVVLDDREAPVGLLVDSADDISTFDRHDMTPAPESSLLTSSIASGGVPVLDPAAVLRDPRLFLRARPEPTEATPWHDA